MPLSRHFYSLDEVQAALLHTTSRSNTSESLFWCKELLLSGCVGEAISTLFESWLWHTGPYRLQWLIDAWKTLAAEETSEDDILIAANNLSSISYSKRDNSLWSVLVTNAIATANASGAPDRVTPKTPAFLPSKDLKEIYFVRALYQGKARSAWWISQYFSPDRCWELLDWYAEKVCGVHYSNYKICFEALFNYDKLLGYKSSEYDVICRCMAILMLCIRPEVRDQSFKAFTSEIKDKESLDVNIGLKSRRLLNIPTACLYGITGRGYSSWSQNNLVQLNNIEKYLVGCPFWDDGLTDYAVIDDTGTIQWNSDNDMEEFYDKYFPDDIPDEWTAADKNKSHGGGVIAPGDKPTIWKYSRNNMMKTQHLCWDSIRDENKILKDIDIGDCNLSRIVELYKTPGELDLEVLSPVRKRKIV